ncbi:MAG: hypothetical protein ACI4RT_03750 [Candidatus Spyradenecus sp.]
MTLATRMTREMLAADKAYTRRRKRARRARKVHAPALIRPEHFAPAPRPLTPYLDLILAAILWTLAFACVGATLWFAGLLMFTISGLG